MGMQSSPHLKENITKTTNNGYAELPYTLYVFIIAYCEHHGLY